MSKIIPSLTVATLLLSGCGFLQPVEVPELQTQQSTQESTKEEAAQPSNQLITKINERLPLYTTFSKDLEGFSTEGTIVTYYLQGETAKKIHVVYFGETGKRINQFYFDDDEELGAATTTLYNYNGHIMEPDFNENNATVESQTIIYPEKEVSKTGDDLMMEGRQLLHSIQDPVDPFGQWTYYQKDYFSLSYPPGFTAVEEAQDYGTFVSPDGEVTVSLYSPLWTGNPDKLLLQPGETISSTKEETTASSGNELGEGTTRAAQWMTMKADDDSYTRSIVDNRLIGPGNSSETRLTWSIQYQNQEAYNRYRDQYIKMKESLTQYAD